MSSLTWFVPGVTWACADSIRRWSCTVNNTLKIDAGSTVTFKNEVESTRPMSIYSASGSVVQSLPSPNLDARALAAMSEEEFAQIFSRLQNTRDKARLRELMGS